MPKVMRNPRKKGRAKAKIGIATPGLHGPGEIRSGGKIKKVNPRKLPREDRGRSYEI